MSSLLSPFSFGQQKQSYFQVKLTIHELNSVPLVTGYFHVKWRFKNVHSIQHASTHHLGRGHPHHHPHDHDRSHSHRSSPKSNKSASLKGSPEKKFISLPREELDQSEIIQGTDTDKGKEKGKEKETEHEEVREVLEDDVENNSGGDDDAGMEDSKRKLVLKKFKEKGGGRFLSGVANALHLKKNSESEENRTESITDPGSPSSSKQRKSDVGGDSAAQSEQPKSASTTSSFPSIITDDSRHSFASSRNTFDSENEKIPSKGKGKEKEHNSGHLPNSASSSSFSHPLKPNFKHSNHSSSSVNHHANSDPGTHFEPRGETNSARVYEHKVIWERSVETGIRINIEKPRVVSGSSSKSNNHNEKESKSSSKETGLIGSSNSSNVESSPTSIHPEKERLSQKSSLKDLRNREKNDGRRESRESVNPNQMSGAEEDESVRDAWGYLAKSELRLSVKQHVDADTPNSSSDVPHRLGFVVLNLAEFAPKPPSREYHHHHHHHHQHHHHHPHHHHSNHIPPHAPKRSETRRYLLQESKTNATLKVTIEMTYIGGSREYSVPSLKRGFVVGGLGGLVDETKGIGSGGKRGEKKRKKHSSNSNSEGSETGSLLNGTIGGHSTSRNQSSTSLNQYHQNSKSATSLISNHNSNGVGFRSGSIFASKNPSTQARIPLSNLKTGSSSGHKDKRGDAKNKTRDANLSFNFKGASNHDKSPETIIEAIFIPSPVNNATLMLKSTVNRSDKVKPEKKRIEESGRKSPVPASLYPIESIESGSSGTSIRRDQLENSDGKRKGMGLKRPEMKRSLSEKNSSQSNAASINSSLKDANLSNQILKIDPRKSHNRSSSASTMRSILTNSGATSTNDATLLSSSSSSTSSTNSTPNRPSPWSSTSKEKIPSVRWRENTTNSVDSSTPSSMVTNCNSSSNSVLLGSDLNLMERRKVLTSSPDPIQSSRGKNVGGGGNINRPETPTSNKDVEGKESGGDGVEIEVPNGLTLPENEVTPRPHFKS